MISFHEIAYNELSWPSKMHIGFYYEEDFPQQNDSGNTYRIHSWLAYN